MKRSTIAMLLATIASSAIATGAQAQSTPTPTNGSIRGAGATSIQNVLVQELNCIGLDQQLGSSSPNPNGSLSTVPSVSFDPGVYGAGFICDDSDFDVRFVQDEFSGRYIGTGSGFGRQAWRLNTNQFSPTTAGVNNPFVALAGDSTWDHVQFGFSDGGAAPSDIQAYRNSTTGASTLGGNPIQFPKYVLPVAVAYDARYGRNTSTNTDYTFNVTTPRTINGVAAGGLQMSRDTYCRVFNGDIVNFNDSAFTADNGGVSLQDPDDSAARWSTDGVPVRLVGRLDRSGTTDIFTRALAEQCDAMSTGAANKYATNAESLPYTRGGAVPDFSSVRSDTGYSATSTAAVSGTANTIGNQYFTGTAIASVGGGSPSNPSGNAGSGLYLVADGSGRVRDAINFAPDYASPTASNVLLNGKIGYIGSDFVSGSESASVPLFAAALQNPNSGTFEMPSADAGTTALGNILPPESDTAGVWTGTDIRTVRSPVSGTTTAARTNPLAWYDVLYVAGSTLANPSAGYPVTGTTQFLGHQCYTAANRLNMVEFLGDNFDLFGTDENGNPLPTGMFAGTSPAGIAARSNIGIMPNAWRHAITETFLRNSSESNGTTTLGAQNLWIQNDVSRDASTTSNPTVCGSLPGA